MSDRALDFQLVPPAERIRFGPFEAAPRSGELRKHGIKVRIGQQSFQVLLMLLERPGEMVSRDDLRLRLWPQDTVVEFDHSINAAIQKLRAALGESAEEPRYIETLPRRGYRFIGTVDAPAVSPVLISVPPHATNGESAPPVAIPGEDRKGHGRLMLGLAAAMALVVSVALALLHPWDPRMPVRNWTLALGNIDERGAVVSPDGSAVVYSGRNGIFLRRMNSNKEIQIYPFPASDIPAWSADGSEILFPETDGLVRMPVPNGPVKRITPLAFPTRGTASGPDGSVLVAMFTGKAEGGDLYLVRDNGAGPTRLDMPGLPGGMFFYPEFLADGKNILFAWARAREGHVGLYLATIENGKVTRGPILLIKNVAGGRYSPWGGDKLLYLENDNLYAQRLNVIRGALEGPAEEVLDGVVSEPGRHIVRFSVSRNGVLVWRGGSVALAQLTWFDRAGKVLGTSGPPCLPELARISPDEKRVVFRSYAEGPGYSVTESNRSGFVSLSGLTWAPLWMPRNSNILYRLKIDDGYRLVERAAEGGPERELRRAKELGPFLDVSPDGKLLLFHSGLRLFTIRTDDSNSEPKLVANTAYGRFSPDGRWIVYPDFSDKKSLFVRSVDSRGLPTQLTADVADNAAWRGDGEEIVYRGGTKIYSIRVSVKGDTLSGGPPQPLFEVRVPAGMSGDSMPLDITRDGSRILFAQGAENLNSSMTYVMTDWTSTLHQ